jgi:hypothetical protein
LVQNFRINPQCVWGEVFRLGLLLVIDVFDVMMCNPRRVWKKVH